MTHTIVTPACLVCGTGITEYRKVFCAHCATKLRDNICLRRGCGSVLTADEFQQAVCTLCLEAT